MSYETRNTLSADWSESAGLDPKKNNNTVRAFVVGEDFAGMRAQALGLAERAGWAGTFHPVALNSAARLAMSYAPAWARQVLFQKWDKTALLPYLQSFKQADPAVIISVGAKGALLGRRCVRNIALLFRCNTRGKISRDLIWSLRASTTI